MRPLEGKMPGTPNPDPMSTKQQRIAELAKQSPQMAFTSLAHHIDIDWLQEAYRRTRKDGAVGVDGQTAADYEADLEGNLQSLLDRAKSGTLPGPAGAAGAHPEGDRVRRPGRSGFPRSRTRSSSGRSSCCWSRSTSRTSWTARTASGRGDRRTRRWTRFWHRLMEIEGGWVLEVDIRKFFDTLDHAICGRSSASGCVTACCCD